MFVAQHTKLLRERWLPDASDTLKRTDILFALGKLAQKQKSVFVGQ